MGLTSDNKASLIGAGVSAGSGLIGSALGFAAGRMNYKYNKKLMALQNQYNIDAFNRENERQDWLLQNQALLNKIGLRKAGFSTADPNGTGFSAGSMNTQEGPSIPGGADFDFGSPFAQVASTYASIRNASAQADLAEANAKIANIEAEKRAESIQANIDKVRADITAIQEKLPEEINLLKMQALSAGSQAKYNGKQLMFLDKDIERIGELIKGIKIDNSYKPLINDAQIQSLVASAYLANENGRWQGFLNELASHGIIAGQDGWTNLFNIILNHPDIAGKLIDGVEKLTSSIPGVGAVVNAVAKKAKDAADAMGESYEPAGSPSAGSMTDTPLWQLKQWAKARDEWTCKKAHVSDIKDVPPERLGDLYAEYNKQHPFTP